MTLVQTYALPDQKSSRAGAVRINRDEAQAWNQKGYGIYQTVNSFRGARRIENLAHINAWYADIDGGEKTVVWKRIEAGLIPTMVVETKNGFHVYWKAKDATVENWRAIMENRLIPFYSADPKAKDLARLLRVPGFLHQKDPANPFLVRKVHEAPVEYTEREMLLFYPDVVTPEKQRREHARAVRANPLAGDFWDRVWALDCEYALTTLSGHDLVNGEHFSFRPNASGTKNIYVNGSSTSCWIDRDGRIGSLDHGGPTIAAWLRWYGHPWPLVIESLKQIFPELNVIKESA